MECAICLNELDGVWERLNCAHEFHAQCIGSWLYSWQGNAEAYRLLASLPRDTRRQRQLYDEMLQQILQAWGELRVDRPTCPVCRTEVTRRSPVAPPPRVERIEAHNGLGGSHIRYYTRWSDGSISRERAARLRDIAPQAWRSWTLRRQAQNTANLRARRRSGSQS